MSEHEPMDPHTALLERAAAALAARFPNAGIGVTGSVAAGRHHADSDLDLLVVDAGIQRDWQMAFVEAGIRVNVLCVHPQRFAAQLRADAGAFAAVRASYVLNARPLRDPGGHLDLLKDDARAALELRESARGELMARLEGAARARLARNSGALDGWAAAALRAAAEGAHLRAGRTALEKGEGNAPLRALQRYDPGLYARMRAVLGGTIPVREGVAAILTEVFGDGSGQVTI